MNCAGQGCQKESEYAPVLEFADPNYGYPKVYIAVGISFCKDHCVGKKEDYLRGQEETIKIMFESLGHPVPSTDLATLKFWPIGKLRGQIPVIQIKD